jgi:PBSX family phage terminase large subunit
VDNVFAFAHELKTTKDKLHLATGSTMANAKLNIGDANGFGLEYIFRGQCHWGKYKDNEALYIKGPATGGRQRVVLFSGSAKADSYKKIRGNSYGLWIATEINLHHESFIKEAFNRTAAADRRKFFWDLNPEAPRHWVYENYIDKYRAKDEAGDLLGGCNYQHFTIDDNINISEERRAEIKSQYDPGSIWYMRDILGRRMAAEGVIYRRFIEGDYTVPADMLDAEGRVKDLRRIIVGVDFGGNGSGHAFVAVGLVGNYSKVVVLRSERHFGDIAADDLAGLFVSFCDTVQARHGSIYKAYCDSAEPVLIRTLKRAAQKAGIRTLVMNASKTSIIGRIRAVDMLINQERLYYVPGQADSFRQAMCEAVWDEKKTTENVRKDDGSSDIDTLDAFEYTIENYIKQLLRGVRDAAVNRVAPEGRL